MSQEQFRRNAAVSNDLAKMGTYFIGVALIVSSFAFAGTAALRELPESPLFGWATSALSPAPETHQTRLSQAVANAREIRAALAKPIPRPVPLPPITAKLAYGHLKPGGNGAISVANVDRKPKLPKAGMDAMAMSVSSSNYRASSAVVPEMHRVY